MAIRRFGRAGGILEMLPTQSAGAGAFADFDLTRVPSPCFVVDEVSLERNLQILDDVQKRADVKILLALKAFSMWSLADTVGRYLSGTCASGLWEAQLARQYYSGSLTSYAPAYKADEIAEISALSDHVIFNSPAQVARFAEQALAGGADVGLRLNPLHSEGLVARYDPCAAGSRLGFPIDRVGAQLPAQVSGLHIHSLCEQGFEPLERTIDAIRPYLETWRGQYQWLNLGGGHLITSPSYQRDRLVDLLRDLRQRLDVEIYLEPGAAVAFDTGILVGEVLDVIDNDGPIAISDISATCHMPDVLEAPYRPALLGEVSAGDEVMIAGPSCLAGDMVGRYRFPSRVQTGQRFAFLDQSHYSMVKTTTFNGVILPSIAIWNSQSDDLRMVRRFGYEDFAHRLS